VPDPVSALRSPADPGAARPTGSAPSAVGCLGVDRSCHGSSRPAASRGTAPARIGTFAPARGIPTAISTPPGRKQLPGRLHGVDQVILPGIAGSVDAITPGLEALADELMDTARSL
jgi:hypothetical protein